MENAKPGVPYSITNIMQELEKVGAMDYSVPKRETLRLVLEHLITKHKWVEVGNFGNFAALGNATFRDIIDGAMPRNAPFNREDVRRMMAFMTGEELEANTISKGLERLVKDGRVIRTERGKYKRTHVGL